MYRFCFVVVVVVHSDFIPQQNPNTPLKNYYLMILTGRSFYNLKPLNPLMHNGPKWSDTF